MSDSIADQPHGSCDERLHRAFDRFMLPHEPSLRTSVTMTAEQSEEILRTLADDAEGMVEHLTEEGGTPATIATDPKGGSEEPMQGSTTFPLSAVTEALRDGAAAIRALRLVSDRSQSR